MIQVGIFLDRIVQSISRFLAIIMPDDVTQEKVNALQLFISVCFVCSYQILIPLLYPLVKLQSMSALQGSYANRVSKYHTGAIRAVGISPERQRMDYAYGAVQQHAPPVGSENKKNSKGHHHKVWRSDGFTRWAMVSSDRSDE
jgi:hypothetical protein